MLFVIFMDLIIRARAAGFFLLRNYHPQLGKYTMYFEKVAECDKVLLHSNAEHTASLAML